MIGENLTLGTEVIWHASEQTALLSIIILGIIFFLLALAYFLCLTRGIMFYD
jgi:hypothetical protein